MRSSVLVLDLQLRPLLLQRRDRLVVEDLRQGLRARLELLVERLGLHPLLLGLRRHAVVLGQRLREHVLLLVDVDDLLVALELDQRALRFLELRLRLRELFLEEGLRVRRRIVAALEIDVDEVLRQRVEGIRRQLAVRRIEEHPHQPRIADRLDRQRIQEHADRRRVRIARGWFLGGRFAAIGLVPVQLQQTRPPGRGVVLLRRRLLAEVQLLDDTLGQRAALQQLVLRAIEVESPLSSGVTMLPLNSMTFGASRSILSVICAR